MVLESVSTDQDDKKSVIGFGYKNPDQSLIFCSKIVFEMHFYNKYLCCQF